MSRDLVRTALFAVWLLLPGPGGLSAGDAKTWGEPRPAWQLAFRFVPDQSVHYDDRYRSTLDLRKGGIRLRVTNNSDSLKHYRVLAIDEQGDGLIETVIDRVKIVTQNGDEPPVHVDSTKKPDESPEDFLPLLKTIGRPIARSRCGTNGTLLKVLSVSSTWVKAHPGSTSRSMVRSMENRSFLVPLPAEPVAVGATWNEDFQAAIVDADQRRQQVALRRVYTLKQVDGPLATITWKTIRLTPNSDRKVLLQLIQVLSKGTVLFDLKRGLLISKTTRIDQTIVAPFGDDTLVTARTTHTLVLAAGD